MFYLQVYNTIALTIILILFIVTYNKISSPLNIISTISDRLGINIDEVQEPPSVTTENIRDGISADLMNLASIAQQHYRKPSNMGGGEGTFNGLQIPTQLYRTNNGNYRVRSLTPQKVLIEGIGDLAGRDGRTNLVIIAEVNPGHISLKVEN